MTRRQSWKRRSTSLAAVAAVVAGALAQDRRRRLAARRGRPAGRRVRRQLSGEQFGALRGAGIEPAEVAVTRGALLAA